MIWLRGWFALFVGGICRIVALYRLLVVRTVVVSFVCIVFVG